jgi:hypothetical protein
VAITRKNFNTKATLTKIYPMVEAGLKKNYNKWKHCMSNFMQKRSAMLFDTMPCDRIYYYEEDAEELFAALGISKDAVETALHDTYYWSIEPFKPSSAKDPLTIVVLCIVRYFLKEKKDKDLSLALVYQSFSGKYYPSIHYGFFKKVTPAKYRHIMEYVVNYKLSHKFELKAAGSVIGAVKTTNETWLKTYTKLIMQFEDEDITYIIQQLHNRIKSFMKNVATVYYDTYKNREYISYDKDSLPEEEGSTAAFHLANNDSFKLQQYVEKTMERINTSQVDYKICKAASDSNVSTEEVRSIFEAILNNRKNIPIIKEYITDMIASFLAQSTVKDVTSINFYKTSISAKPNTKDPIILRMKEIIETLLEDNSVSYRKRKHRIPTKASYHKAFAIYFTILIINANK